MKLVTTQQPTVTVIDEFDGAQRIAEVLREIGGQMQLDSEIRGMALRSASRWDIIAGTRPVSLVPPGGRPRIGRES